MSRSPQIPQSKLLMGTWNTSKVANSCPAGHAGRDCLSAHLTADFMLFVPLPFLVSVLLLILLITIRGDVHKRGSPVSFCI